jgi:very-short-patch-repair endonuclease
LRSGGIRGFKFFRQYSVGPYILDFYCPERRLGVEVDGGQHGNAPGKEHDARRAEYLSDLNIRIARFWNNDVLQNIEGVGRKIAQELGQHS